MWRLVIVVAATACYRPGFDGSCELRCDPPGLGACSPGFECGGDGVCKTTGTVDCAQRPRDAGLDAELDAAIDGPPGTTQVCAGGLFRTCVETPPMHNVTYDGDSVIDTASLTTCSYLQPQMSGPMVCVIAAGSFTIDAAAKLRVVGPRPLAFFAINDITVLGTIDASSTRSGGPGGGANAGTGLCSPAGSGSTATVTGGGASGGAGGARGGSGGRGGSVPGLVTPNGPNAGGVLTSLRGGCTGGKGGTAAGAGGDAGDGGGAVYLLALGTVRLGSTAVINVSGAGGVRRGCEQVVVAVVPAESSASTLPRT